MGTEVFHALKRTLHDRGLSTAGGDEGGFAPDLELQRGGAGDARRGHRGGRLPPGEDVAIALDPATSELYRDGAYVLEHEGRTLSAADLADYWATLASRYPIVSIEDGMDEQDWDGWKTLTERVGASVQLVGDDLFVTNTERLRAWHRARRGQLDPDQGQPDRHALGDASRRSRWRARPATPPS